MTDRARLLVAVCLLEVASGLPYGVVNDLTSLWLTDRGTDLAALGGITLVGLPWTLRALWAPAVDRVGTFRAWMLGALSVCTLGTAALAWGAGQDLPVGPALVGLLVATAVASATQDVAVDGYIVATVPPEDAGRVNGLRIGSYRVAMALAGGGAGWIGGTWGWGWGYAAVLPVFLGLLVAQATAPASPPRAHAPPSHWWRALGEWFVDPASVLLLALALTYKLGDAAMGPMTKPFLVRDVGLTAAQVGLLTSTVGAILIPVGALAGGEITSRLGLVRGLVVCGGLQAISNLVYAGAAWVGGVPAGVVASLGESLTTGLGSAALLALFTRASTGAHAATRFAVCAALMGLTRTVAGGLSGWAVERLDYAPFFALTFVMAIPALLLAPTVGRRYQGGAPEAG